MLRIDAKLPLKYSQNDIKNAILSAFPIDASEIKSFELLKLALDLTDKSSICHKAAIGVCLDSELEEKFKLRKKVCSSVEDLSFSYESYNTEKLSPVVIGAGPCGLFAALTLAEAGARPIVLKEDLPSTSASARWRHLLSAASSTPNATCSSARAVRARIPTEN